MYTGPPLTHKLARRGTGATVYSILPSPAEARETEGTATHISGWKDPFDTDVRLTRYMFSIYMKP